MSRLPSPPPAAPLEDDDLLTEILLHLPPQPSSLPRASLVCRRWRHLVSDPGFVRHFHIRHCRNPPLLGFLSGLNLVPTMEPPNRLPYGRFSLQLDHRGDERYLFFHKLGCRHGLVLIIIFLPKRPELLVCDPITGNQHPIAFSSGFTAPLDYGTIHGAVLRAAAGDVEHFQFQVVMVGIVEQQHNKLAVAQVYSSDTGLWGNIISTPLPPNSMILPPGTPNCASDVLVGDSLYWVLEKSIILEFDLGRQRLSVIPLPVAAESNFEFLVMRADGGGLGCLVLSKFSAQLWKRMTGSDGVASWVLGRSIELDKLLSLNSAKDRRPLKILGFAENNSVVLLRTDIGLFTIELQSLQFKRFIDINIRCCYHPFESVYTAGTVIGGGHNGAEVLDKT